MKNFIRFLLIYTILVILWGAWVRISHSGDGCGESWPLCQGQMIPQATLKKTWVEYGHRLMSGIYGVLVLFIFLVGRQSKILSLNARKCLALILFFTITESLLGAKLVLSGLVTTNSSWNRLFSMGLHQINSFLLTGSVMLTLMHITYPSNEKFLDTLFNKKVNRWPIYFVFGILAIGVTGTWAALSGTVFPSHDLAEELAKDFSSHAHFLIRLRIFHPIIATTFGIVMAAFSWSSEKRSSQLFASALLAEVLFGYATLLNLSPSWMKLSHLAMAHTVWVLLIRFIYLENRRV